MVDVVTYSSENANPKEKWMAYIVLPNKELWMVRFVGATEEEAKDKAIRLYEAERAKVKTTEPDEVKSDGFTNNNPWPSASPSGRGAHFAGKVWLIHKTTREKIRVLAEEVDKYPDYERGGPRSK